MNTNIKRLFSLFNVVSAALLVAAAYAYAQVSRPPKLPEVPVLELVQKRDVQVKVYYSDAQVQTFRPEIRKMQVVQENPTTLAQAALDAWVQQPTTATSLAVVPSGTQPPQVWVRGEHYYVNLPGTYRNLKYGTSGERMLLCTLVRSLLDQRGQDVFFLVDGQDAKTLGHLDLSQSYTREDCADL